MAPVTSSGCFQPVPTGCVAPPSACRYGRESSWSGSADLGHDTHPVWQPGQAQIAAVGRRGPKARQERGQADESIARSAPCGAAAPLPRGGPSGLNDRHVLPTGVRCTWWLRSRGQQSGPRMGAEAGSSSQPLSYRSLPRRSSTRIVSVSSRTIVTGWRDDQFSGSKKYRLLDHQSSRRP